MVDKVRFTFTELNKEMGDFVPLGGNLAQFEARALVVTAVVDRFTPVDLAFAWTMNSSAPLILGHMNFFEEFDVCFYRSELAFEISPRRMSKG